VRERHDFLSLPLLVRPGAVIPVVAHADRPDYAHADGGTPRTYGLQRGAQVTVRVGEVAVHPCEATPAAARRVAEHLLREQPALTGVVVHNEAILEPLIDAFEQLGLRVPGDLSITAICPDELAETLRVPVTSIALPSAEGARGRSTC
jgi:DNA-binding LacI/PurR family transcriptional regulator